MKNLVKNIGILLTIVLCITVGGILSGFNNTEKKEVALALVGSQHSNEPSFPLNAASVKKWLYECSYNSGSVAFVSNDGNPKVVYNADIPKPEKSGLSKSKKRKIALQYTKQLLKNLAALKSEIPEVDTLKAITYASKTLEGNRENTDKVLLVMDNGLSTIGYLDFTKDLLNADTDSVVEALEKVEAIPNLTDVNVVWMYLGQTAAPQHELSEVQKHKLEEIWMAVLQAGGATHIEFTNDIASDEADNILPKVSVVDAQMGVIDEKSIKMKIEPPMKTIILDNTSVQFIGDEAEFIDYDKATEVLSQYAQLLLEHPNNKVYVIGTTASGTPDFCKQLSIDRANAVLQVLISCGVPESQLIPCGMGFENPWHIEDLDENGKLIEKYACQNRKVLLVDVTSEEVAR